MDDDQKAQDGGDDNQNVEEGVINGPQVQLPRFSVVREHDFLNPGNPVRIRRVPVDPDGGDAVLVLDKDLRWSEAAAGYNLLSVYVAEGAGTLLTALTEEEWGRASPAGNPDDFVRVLATGPNGVEYELHLRHCVLEDEPPEYDLSHEWSRVVADYGLMEGDTVEGYGYRDVEDDQLRLELRFFRGDLNLN